MVVGLLSVMACFLMGHAVGTRQLNRSRSIVVKKSLAITSARVFFRMEFWLECHGLWGLNRTLCQQEQLSTQRFQYHAVGNFRAWGSAESCSYVGHVGCAMPFGGSHVAKPRARCVHRF